MKLRLPEAVLAVATIALIALFVTAGNWQRERMNAKDAERAAHVAAAAQRPVPLPATDDWSAWRYRRVTVVGTWRPSYQFLVDNRILDGRAGFAVVQAVALDDDRLLLVDRGWIPAGAGESRVPKVAPLQGRANMRGRIVIPPARYLELSDAGPQGDVWQNLDPRRMTATTGTAFLPIVLEQAPGGREDGLVRRWADPGDGATTHRIYMMQWYAFAALAAGLWLYFTFRRPKPKRVVPKAPERKRRR